MDKVAPNYDRASMLQTAWGTGALPKSMGVDPVGAFRLICAPSHLSYDDPIVYPGQPGKSHLHLFFGNDETDANSTYKSLRSSGTSTCGLLNRSGYWMPALLDGHGNVVLPDYASVYYKRLPDTDPHCAPGAMSEKGCIALPRGLRYVFGRTMQGGVYADNRRDGVNFVCDKAGLSSSDFSVVAKGCPAGAQIGVQMIAPNCWDGKNLDTPDHRAQTHDTTYGNTGVERCPAGYPYILPTFTFSIFFTVPVGGLADAEFSSDKMMGMPAGSTVHADWLGAWDDDTLQAWTKGCIDGHLNGSGGDLCNGQQMVGAQQPTYGWHNPNAVIPVPAVGQTIPLT
ncbi:MAG: DUF1996 domain-containing protein [Sphingomonadaceae bacterium]